MSTIEGTEARKGEGGGSMIGNKSQLCSVSALQTGCFARCETRKGEEVKKKEGSERVKNAKEIKINRVKKGDKIYIYFFFCSSCRRH